MENLEQKVVDAIKAELDKKGYLNADGVDLLIAEAVSKIEMPDTKSIAEQVEKIGTKLTEMQEQRERQQPQKSAQEIIREKHPEWVRQLEQAQKTRQPMKLIVDLPETKTLLQRSAAGSFSGALYLPDIGQEAYRGLVMANLFNQRTLPAGMFGTVRYLDQTTVTRSAAEKAEGAAFAESALAWTEYYGKIEKITDSIPVTWEALQDLSFVENEIMRMMEVNIALREDLQLWSGDGNTPNIKGIYTYSSAVNIGASAFANTVVAPNIADLALAMSTLISTSKESKYMPNTVIMSPTDWTKLRLDKNSYGYVQNPLMTPDGMTIAGMRVAVSSAVTANTLLVGDFRYADRYTDGTIRMEFGHVNNQFIEDEMTLKAAKREFLLVRNVDTTAFLKCTSISTALTALTAGS